MRIVAYRDHHFNGVDRLWLRAFPDDPPRNRAANSIPPKLAQEDELFWVALDEQDTVIGTIMAGWDGHRGWLYSLAVDPDHRFVGLGSALVETAISGLAGRGCTKVNLQIRAVNEGLVTFYEKLGFQTEPRISMGREI